MSSKQQLNQYLGEAASLRRIGEFTKAFQILKSLESDPDVALLGHNTSLGLPRRLHSAFLKLAKAENNALLSIGYQYNLVPPTEVLNKYTAFSIAERKAINQVNGLSIPKIIHQIWIGSSDAPVGTQAWQAHAKQHGYEYQLWHEASLKALGIEENSVYRGMLQKGDFPGAVDVARYLVLQRLGGVYLDCDWYPVRDDISFHDLLPMVGLTTMPEDTPRLTGKGCTLMANSFIATPAGHPIFTRLIDALNEVTAELPKAPAWWSTGPLMFTLMCRGGAVTLADADFVAGSLPQETPYIQVQNWCEQTRQRDSGLLLAWRSWVR